MTITLRCPATREIHHFESEFDIPETQVFEKVYPFQVLVNDIHHVQLMAVNSTECYKLLNSSEFSRLHPIETVRFQ